MRSTSWTLCAVIAILVVLAIPGPASAQLYNFTVLDPPNADPATGETSPVGINKSGVIVGFYQDSSFVRHGFVSQPPYSTFTVIDAPGAGTGFDQGTQAYGINTNGVITGLYTDTNYVDHGFVSSPPYTSFVTVNATNAGGGSPCQILTTYRIYEGTFPSDINDSGAVAGNYVDSSCVFHGFVSNPPYTSFTTIDAPKAGTSFTYEQGYLEGTTPDSFTGLNDSGMVSGNATDSNGASHGFIYSGGKVTGFDVSGAGTAASQGTFPGSINSKGVIAGYFADSGGVNHGFQRNPDGQILKFDVPGAGQASGQGTFVSNISFQRFIVGYYIDSNGVSHGFLVNPGGNIQTFSDPNAGGMNGQGTYPASNNQGGSITGTYYDSSNGSHGFVAIPTP